MSNDFVIAGTTCIMALICFGGSMVALSRMDKVISKNK